MSARSGYRSAWVRMMVLGVGALCCGQLLANGPMEPNYGQMAFATDRPDDSYYCSIVIVLRFSSTTTEMANELWVKWTGGVRATRVLVQDLLGRPAEIDDLCRKFVLDRKWPTVDPASLQVFDKEGDGRTEQTSSTKLKNFFVDYSEGAPNNGPRQSEGTALFIFVGGTL